jgi:hypothetical protein
MGDAFSGTTTDDKGVQQKGPAPIGANSDSAFNEIGESERRSEKHDEQRI